MEKKFATYKFTRRSDFLFTLTDLNSSCLTESPVALACSAVCVKEQCVTGKMPGCRMKTLTYGCTSTIFCFSKSTNTGKKESGRRSDTWSRRHAVKGRDMCVCIYSMFVYYLQIFCPLVFQMWMWILTPSRRRWHTTTCASVWYCSVVLQGKSVGGLARLNQTVFSINHSHAASKELRSFASCACLVSSLVRRLFVPMWPDRRRENMSFRRLRAIISTVCVFGQYTRSEEMQGSEQHLVASLTSAFLNADLIYLTCGGVKIWGSLSEAIFPNNFLVKILN